MNRMKHWLMLFALGCGLGLTTGVAHGAANGIIYAITQNNDLMWYRHDGRNDGTFRWAFNEGKKVGNGWNVKQVFSGATTARNVSGGCAHCNDGSCQCGDGTPAELCANHGGNDPKIGCIQQQGFLIKNICYRETAQGLNLSVSAFLYHESTEFEISRLY